jgi:type IV secretory pathway ATPase VirB11/archaellum biosynthesis ATPase
MEGCRADCRPLYVKRAGRLILKCPEGGLEGDLATNAACRGRVAYLLCNISAEEVEVRSRRVKRVYVGEALELLRGYAKALSRARWRSLDEKLLQPCGGPSSCLEARRRFLQALLSPKPPLGKLYSDPVAAILNIEGELLKLEAAEGRKRGCNLCLKSYEGALRRLKGEVKSTELYRKLAYVAQKVGSAEEAYAQVLKASRVEALHWSPEEEAGFRGKEPLDEYEVPPFRVRIMRLSPVERLYVPSPSLSPWELSLMREAARRVRGSSSYVYSLAESRLSLLLELKRREAEAVLRRLWPEGVKEACKARNLVEATVYKSLGLLKVAPFLLDDQVEEFFLDKPFTHVYLHHARWGRCRSSVVLSGKDVERIMTHLKAESGRSVDYENPSLKCDLITPSFHVRASVDVPPLAVDGPALDFRKLRKKLWTLPELVANGTLTSELAAYLLFCFFRRRNITVVGEPDTGKTTLVNALDLCAPPHWRKIYVEDVTESVSQRGLGRHQVRLKVDPLESGRKSFTKSLEVLKLLHRSPDVMILSEIQTPEHTKALFQALGAGLRGLQTCHASTVEGLLRRWVLHHGVHPANILDLDVIVLMKTLQAGGREVRRVVKVSEVEPAVDGSGFKLVEVFSWNPGVGLLKSMDLYETPTLMRVRELEGLPKAKFQEELRSYAEAMEELAASRAGPEEAAERLTTLYFRYAA